MTDGQRKWEKDKQSDRERSTNERRVDLLLTFLD